MSRGKERSRAFTAACTALILFQIVLYAVFGSFKQGYFIDEIFSYGLSNSYDKPFLSTDLQFDQWTEQSEFLRYVEVEPEHRFAYGSVYKNQEDDVHPPLYYFFLHTVCSFFPGSLSKWYGLSLNAVFLVAASLLLLRTGSGVFRDRWLALIVCAAFVFNPIIISCFLFIRMYALLLLLATAYFCLHIRNHRHTFGIKALVLIAVNVFLGFMTHYYFLVLAFAVAAVYVPLLLAKKRWKDAAFYFLALCGGIAAGYFFFPRCVYHIFTGYRGIEAFGKFETLWNSLQASDFVRGELPGFLCMLAGVILVLAFAVRCVLRLHAEKRRTVRIHTTPVTALMISFAVSTALYVGIVSMIAPYDDTRYYFCVFGIGFILAAYFVIGLLTRLIKNRAVVRTLVVVLFAAVTALFFIDEPVGYLYPEQKAYAETIETYRDCSCIYVIGRESGTWHIHDEAIRLSRFDGVYFVEPDDLLDSVQALAAEQALSKQCVLFINLWNYHDINIKDILKISDYTQYQYLYLTDNSCVVLLE